MRFQEKEYISIPVGTLRQRTRFLWFPKKIGKERRWLERATWEVQLEPAQTEDRFYTKWVPTQWMKW